MVIRLTSREWEFSDLRCVDTHECINTSKVSSTTLQYNCSQNSYISHMKLYIALTFLYTPVAVTNLYWGWHSNLQLCSTVNKHVEMANDCFSKEIRSITRPIWYMIHTDIKTVECFYYFLLEIKQTVDTIVM